MKTKRLTIVTLAAAGLLLFSTAGWTADDAEATIRLMDVAEADEPEVVTKQLSIPTHLMQASPAAQQRAVEKSAKGLDNAAERGEKKGFEQRNENRGQERSEEARERGAEMSEKAKENRENKGRSEDRPDKPGKPEGPPGQT